MSETAIVFISCIAFGVGSGCLFCLRLQITPRGLFIHVVMFILCHDFKTSQIEDGSSNIFFEGEW